MGGTRVGEQEREAVGRPRWRRWFVASLIVVVMLVLVVGDALTTQFFSAYPRGACKGVGYASAITADPSAGGSTGFATPEEALAAVAPDLPPLGRQRVPSDGWEEYRGRWVRDMDDGTYYEVDVHETPNGWIADGDVLTCGF